MYNNTEDDVEPGFRGGLGSSKMDTEDEEEEDMDSGSGMGQQSSAFDDLLDLRFGLTKRKRKAQFFSKQNKRSHEADQEFGKFEQHTKGIGLKLMQKMGYKLGEGLGAEGTGIVKPIETKVRPSKMGLAYRGFDERTDKAKSEKNDIVEKVSIKPVQKEKPNAWRKSKKPKTAKAEYKTADEVMNESETTAPVQPMKIVDMTGPQVREISSASQIKSHAILDSSSRLPELRHNLRLIVDMSKSDLEHFTRERRIQNEKKKSLNQDVIRLSTLVEDEAKRISQLDEVMSILKECDRLLTVTLSTDSPELNVFSELFEKLFTNYPDEFVVYGLDAAVVSIISPVLKKSLSYWEPLGNPQLGLQELQQWSQLFKTSSSDTNVKTNYNGLSRSKEKIMTPYENMMFNIWLPKVRSAINNDWNVRDFDPAIRLLENWRPPLLPEFIYENIIDQLIMPKLIREVDSWNPRNDTEMVHQWLHPWLPLLRERLDPLYANIRQKFRLILQNWDPADSRALEILRPWKNVFQPTDMQSFLVKYILPKLNETMHAKFQINPRKQELELFNCVMNWRNLFVSDVFCKLFETEFFQKWLDVLYIWLTHNPNYVEIRQWYLFWKELFPQEMLTDSLIEAQFMRGLSLIDKSISLGREASSRLPHPSSEQIEQMDFNFESFQIPSVNPNTMDTEISFVELVEEFAQERNILFLPLNKTHKTSGKSLYRMGGTSEGIGGVTMFFQDDVMFVKKGQDWQPVGFEEILEMV